ncbi:hypothetical protein [Alteromonas sp. KUL49]|uniref:hypothetical protein n=1 Tax=Alteromonas sp. KUL49 TaxID=2480798 RepID=UPI0010FFC2FA|nr:hypothetical protein [Alteromonas sp. KUL49]GEA12714.1 hypothetical protein KUL49_30890 [Alteromonas sp. KUL49]
MNERMNQLVDENQLLKKQIQGLEESLDKADDLLSKIYESGVHLQELEAEVHHYLVLG